MFGHDLNNAINFLGKITIQRLINSIKLRISYGISVLTRKYVHFGYPESLSVEPTTNCNLGCLECPVGVNSLNRPLGNISTKLYKKVINEIGKYIYHLNLYFQGEPFLNPNIFELIEFAHSKKIYVTISTNGHYLSENIVNRIIDSKLDKIIVSLDGLTQESYEKYRKKGNLDSVLIGLKRLSVAKKKKNSKFPYIEVQFIAFRHNEHEIQNIQSFFKDIEIQKIAIKKAFIEDTEDPKKLLPKNENYLRYKKNKKGQYFIKSKLWNKCWRSWHSVVITWDGKLAPCCFDKDAKYSFGNVSKSSFKQLWDNNNAQIFRAQILKDRNQTDICTNCVEGIKFRI